MLTKDNWYVISGVNALEFEFYEKFYESSDSAGSSWYVYFDFIYPHAQHEKYDPMVATIAAGSRPASAAAGVRAFADSCTNNA